MAKRAGLGKGLDALFIDNNTDDSAVSRLKITQIEPNKDQPRVNFDNEALKELADSIREHGVIQPLIVRPVGNGGSAYQIVAGERRWRASRMAGLNELPVIIRELTDAETLEIAIIENLQREDLNVIELANGYKALMQEFGLTQEQVAVKLGKSRPVVANTIRLLALPEEVIGQIKLGNISHGHAKALLSLEDNGLIKETAHKVVNDKILVRDIEKLARERKAKESEGGSEPERAGKKSKKDAGETSWGNNYYKEMELAIGTELGRRVVIEKLGNKSVIQLEFYSDSELADIAARLTRSDH